MERQKDLGFPSDVHRRVATLLTIAMNLMSKGQINAQPVSDRVIHDILCDYYGKKRVFDIYDPDKEFRDKLEYIKNMSDDELIREINASLSE